MGPPLRHNAAIPLPKTIRRLTPDRARHSPRLRAAALSAGLIPPRTMHSPAEAELLARLARDRRVAVEVGVYEGSSALALCGALPARAELHLIDPYIENALLPGWRASAWATRRVVERAVRRRGGPGVRWWVQLSAEAAARWSGPIDLLFIDADHTEEGCRADWELWSPFLEPGGIVAFHDARANRPGGWGLQGPTAVVDALFRTNGGPAGWRIVEEVDTTVAVQRT